MCNNTFTQLMISAYLCQFCFYGITLILSLSLVLLQLTMWQWILSSYFPLCTAITITVDDITEPEETFSVTLVPVSDYVTLGNTTTSSVVIDDNDRKCLPARLFHDIS